jgi:phage replication O-like protein O
MKISAPNYTQIPNDLLEYWLPQLGEAELKVLLVIMRKTLGWHKKREWICNTQLMKSTGLCLDTVISAARALQEKGLILRQVDGPNGKQRVYYELVIYEDSNNSYPSTSSTRPLDSNPRDQVDPQKKDTYIKETTTTERAATPPVAAAVSFYEFLKTSPEPIPQDVMESVSGTYPEERVKNALEFAIANQHKIQTTFVAYFLMACKKGLKVPEKKKQPTPYEALCKMFKHGEVYNGAICNLKPTGIAFDRGIKHGEVLVDEFFSFAKVEKLCEHFGIEMPKKT